jgi:hypothetical protein
VEHRLDDFMLARTKRFKTENGFQGAREVATERSHAEKNIKVRAVAARLPVLFVTYTPIATSYAGAVIIRPSSARRLALFLVLLPLWSSCGKDSPTPTAPPTQTTPPPAQVTRVAIGGSAALTAIGETVQLMATATLSDNSTKDVTRDGVWQGSDTRVATIDAGGLVTVMGFGAMTLSFSHLGRFAELTVTATPAGSFVISGIVREPGVGGVGDVRVLDTLSGRSTMTNAVGYYSLAQLPRAQARIQTDKVGYEPAEADVTANFPDLPVQRIVRVTAGDTVSPASLAPNDRTYTVGPLRCSDCHVIRVVMARAGTLRVRVTWPRADQELTLFADDLVQASGKGELQADLVITSGREVLVYLGTQLPTEVTDHTPFTFITSVR